jgi:chromosome partitioning protein
MVILFGGEKGGTGKSTTAFNVSIYALLKGKDILFVDADPQLSSSKSIARRKKIQLN